MADSTKTACLVGMNFECEVGYNADRDDVANELEEVKAGTPADKNGFHVDRAFDFSIRVCGV